jgi:cytochrome c oxidase subunit II
MGIAIVLILLVVASVLFNFLSPYWFTPLASNWGQMDDTLIITLWICGAVFIAVTLFMAYALMRFSHKEGRRAAYEPENKRLEWWLIGITSIGIVAMLVPGLYVWAKFVDVPKDALRFEALGQQWMWNFRFPGKDGKFGTVDTKFIGVVNPFGLHTGNAFGQDDILIGSNEVHLPVNRPAQVLLRSKDVLHDFYIPQFRVKMDAVPGMITGMWFTPTKTGTYEVACAEYCGVGHHGMRGVIVVEDETAFQAWLGKQQTFAQSVGESQSAGLATGGDLVTQGQKLAQGQGCLACHSVDGSPSAGPSWKGLFGKNEAMVEGPAVKVDEAYIKESIANPSAKVVKGFAPVMPPYKLEDKEVDALIAYAKSLSGGG